MNHVGIFTILIVIALVVSKRNVSGRIVPHDDQLSVQPPTREGFCEKIRKMKRSRSVEICNNHNNNNKKNNNNNNKTTKTKTNNIIRLDSVDHSCWSLRSDDLVYQDIPVKVPGDIITDLHDAKLIEEPFFDNNFLTDRHVWMGGNNDDDDDDDDDDDNDNEDQWLTSSFLQNTVTQCNSRGSSNSGNSSNHHDRNVPIKQNYFIPGLKARTRSWTYERNFTLGTNSMSKYNYVLVVEGIKMGAKIDMNGLHVGNVTNQFRRYVFPLSAEMLKLDLDDDKVQREHDHEREYERGDHHTLSISFLPDIDTQGRFMGCSGGWDWAPYSKSAEASCLSRRVFSFGIVKPIYIVKFLYNDPIIYQIKANAHYLGSEEDGGGTVSITNDHGDAETGPQGNFQLVVDVLLLHRVDVIHDMSLGGTGIGGELVFKASFFQSEKTISLRDASNFTSSTSFGYGYNVTKITLSTKIQREDIQLWWPRGTGGKPNLYTLQVAYRNLKRRTMTAWVKRKIGFRTIRLVTINEFDPSYEDGDKSKEGNGFHGMFFRINGRLINARGANIVPMTQLEGHYDDDAHRILVESAASANMNMLRVWGGGIVFPDSFYRTCDEKGILIYHDLMFVEEQFHSPVASSDVEEEIKHIIRHLISHPSIVLWNMSNENPNTMPGANVTDDIYSDFVMRIVAAEDRTRPVWPSSPSRGLKTGVWSRSGLPNGNSFSYWTSEESRESSIERHGPYLHGWSLDFSSVNGNPTKSSFFDINIPIKVDNGTQIGPRFPSHFVSEFGASVYSSFESMSSTMTRDNWGIHGGKQSDNCTVIFENLNSCSGSNVMSERNYPCDGLIKEYFDVDLDGVGENSFRRQLYLCMISQSLWMKGQIEMHRNLNYFGLLIWQLNENWPTGGWGLLEYGSHSKAGQVIGGRWKPLMYLLKRSLFRDVIAACGVNGGPRLGLCYCRNDKDSNITVTVKIEKYQLATGAIFSVADHQMTLNKGGTIEFFTIDMSKIKPTHDIIVVHVIDNESNEVMGHSVSLFAPPKELSLPNDALVNVLSISAHTSGNRIDITLSSNKLLLYVFLSCGVEGQFEDNAFIIQAGVEKTIQFFPYKSDVMNLKRIKDTLAIEHLAESVTPDVTNIKITSEK